MRKLQRTGIPGGNQEEHTKIKKNDEKKIEKKIQLLQIRTIKKKEEKKWSWINEVLLWRLDLGALIDFVDIRGFGFTTCA